MSAFVVGLTALLRRRGSFGVDKFKVLGRKALEQGLDDSSAELSDEHGKSSRSCLCFIVTVSEAPCCVILTSDVNCGLGGVSLLNFVSVGKFPLSLYLVITTSLKTVFFLSLFWSQSLRVFSGALFSMSVFLSSMES